MPSFGPFTVFTYDLLVTLMSAGLPAAAAIALLTVALRIALLPLTLRQIRAERRMNALKPQLTELATKHRGDPLALHQATLDLYRRENVSPFGGILPVLAQAPFFAVLYSVFLAPTVGGEANLLLAADLFGTPLGARGGAALPVLLGVLVLIAAVATISARRTHRQNRALSWLPYLSVAFAAFVPLAAGVYVLVTTAWSALETAVLRRQPAQPVTQPAG